MLCRLKSKPEPPCIMGYYLQQRRKVVNTHIYSSDYHTKYSNHKEMKNGIFLLKTLYPDNNQILKINYLFFNKFKWNFLFWIKGDWTSFFPTIEESKYAESNNSTADNNSRTIRLQKEGMEIWINAIKTNWRNICVLAVDTHGEACLPKSC